MQLVKLGSLFFLFLFLGNGVNFSERGLSRGINHVYENGSSGGGVSFVDFNDDGWDDITLASEDNEKIHFYKNENGIFKRINLNIDHEEEAKQVLWVDFDNDGDKDFYVTTYEGINRLYKNNGELDFTDITTEAGLPSTQYRSYGASWGDYNRDGWLDLYYVERIHVDSSEFNTNRLYFNNADGSFTDVTDITNTAAQGRKPFCSSFFDYNNDKWPDIYIANDRHSGNIMLKNIGGDSFEDMSMESVTGFEMDAMCVTIGDYNYDGWQDIYVTNTEQGNILLQNLGEDSPTEEISFDEVAAEKGVGFYSVGWGSVFFDADNDTDLDLYVSGSLPGTSNLSSAFYQNNDGLFSIPDDAGFAADSVISYGNAIGDFNNDGFYDIIVNNSIFWKSQLWDNSGNFNSWLKIKLNGIYSNRDGIGSLIEWYADGIYQNRYTQCGSGYLGQHSNIQILGLADAESVDSIIITWPTGHVDKLENIESQQIIEIEEGVSTNGEITVDPDVEIVFVSNTELFDNDNELKIFPNPTSGIFQISSNSRKIKSIVLCTIDGLALIQESFDSNNKTLDISRLPNSVYLLFIQTEGEKRHVAKIIKTQ